MTPDVTPIVYGKIKEERIMDPQWKAQCETIEQEAIRLGLPEDHDADSHISVEIQKDDIGLEEGPVAVVCDNTGEQTLVAPSHLSAVVARLQRIPTPPEGEDAGWDFWHALKEED
jgi:hypothetical protein